MEDARKERLSAKLLELASKPKPEPKPKREDDASMIEEDKGDLRSERLRMESAFRLTLHFRQKLHSRPRPSLRAKRLRLKRVRSISSNYNC